MSYCLVKAVSQQIPGAAFPEDLGSVDFQFQALLCLFTRRPARRSSNLWSQRRSWLHCFCNWNLCGL